MAGLAVAMVGSTAVPAAVTAQTDTRPWEALTTPGINPAAEGQGFNLNASDLAFILEQIKISEAHAATSTASNPCGTLIGNGPNQIPAGPNAHLQSLGIRTITGECNNLLPGQEFNGAADQGFKRLTTPEYRQADFGDPDGPGPAGPTQTDYADFANPVIDHEPRMISNLIVDQNPTNPAATAAAGDNPVIGSDGSYVIENVAPDEGLSAPFNDVFVLFGQFFDHGLDFTTKKGETVFMPLRPSDPLYNPGPTNFMVLTRGIEGDGTEPTNKTTPWVDQQQTYGSHPSVHMFLREYELNGAGVPVATGKLINGHVDPGHGLASWKSLKDQARNILGIELPDSAHIDVPLMAVDQYGRFVRGANGLPQIVLDNGTLLEGNLTTPVVVPANAVSSGAIFNGDIAHNAVPEAGLVPDADTIINDPTAQPAGTYDNEMLDEHFVAGDGRANENIGLSAVHHVFHSEHNRLVDHIKDVLLAAGDEGEWMLSATEWNGERLHNAARFVNSMEYQHLAFEEFARSVQPNVNVFSGYDPTIDAAISVEFSQSVYRYGHSQLREDILRFDVSPFAQANSLTLLEAFLNPPRMFEDANGATMDANAGAAALMRGAVAEPGSQIDEFVLDTLRNNLVGLPLDLAALNIARGREYGIKRLNGVRADLSATNASLQPYPSWSAYGANLRNIESLNNFVAAYGTHPTIAAVDLNSPTALDDLRAAATLIIDVANGDAAPTAAVTFQDAFDFMSGSGTWATQETGINDVDLWVGGLAEANQIAGGMLGSTMDHVFQVQMEELQAGDRFYYLLRTDGMNLLTQLEGNSFSEMIERNTGAANLPADVFSYPAFTFDLQAQTNPNGIVDDPNTPDYDETLLLTRDIDGAIVYSGGEHTNFQGSTGNDFAIAGLGDDTLRGNEGDDRLIGSDGGDQLIGGIGNDKLLDALGDEDIKGGDGHDVIDAGNGLDLLQGGRGNDFITGSTDAKEVLAGPGNDFVLGGDDADEAHGGDGDDWLEGAAGSDNLEGDSGLPLITGVDVNEPGDDVLIGGGGDNRYFGEGGNDIFVLSSGEERVQGQFGFDWASTYNEPTPALTDLSRDAFGVPGPGLEDRFGFVEAASGWDLDDRIDGTDDTAAELLGHELDAAGIAQIGGLSAVLPDGTTSFNGGNILLGGGGSDIISGKGGDDVIDGDAYLKVQIDAGPAGLVDSLTEVHNQLVSDLNFHPGLFSIVRSIDMGTGGTDVVLFRGPLADYDVTIDGNTAVIDHARGDGLSADPTLDDGTDFLRNVEIARFADQDVVIVPSGQQLLLSSVSNTTVPQIGPITDEDIVAYDSVTNQWSMFFDGGDAGIPGGEDIDAFTVDSADGSILMSFETPATLPGLGNVDDSDIVRWNGTSFSMFLTGSQMFGPTVSSGEDITALELLPDGNLLLTLLGVTDRVGGENNRDVLLYNPTTDTMSMYLDGSDPTVDINVSDEKVDALFQVGSDIALSTRNNYNIGGLTGGDEDVVVCEGATTGVNSACASHSRFFDGSAVGLSGEFDIDGMELLGEAGPPPPPAVSIDDVTVVEGDGGSIDAVFTLSLSVSPIETVSVTADTADGSASEANGDYDALTGEVVTFLAGETSQTIAVRVNGDTDVEPNENFFVNLSSPVGVTIGDGQGEGTVIDDDGAPIPTISVDDASVPEGDNGVTAMDFTVELSTAPAGVVTVELTLASGSATLGDDFEDFAVAPLILTWNPGSALAQTVSVDVIGDAADEPNETFTLNAANAVGAAIGDGQGTGTIIDDDDAGAGVVTLMSFTGNHTVPGAGAVRDEDIVSFDGATGLYTMVFDGSAAGVAGEDVNAFTMRDANTILISFDSPANLPGFGSVDDSDIVSYNLLTGQWGDFFWDGSANGLTTSAEDIDALEELADGTLLISTTGNPSVPGVVGAQDRDVLSWNSGTGWAMHMNGSDVELTLSGEDIVAVYQTGTELGLSTTGNFTVDGGGLAGADEDIFVCGGHVAGPPTECGFSLRFDGSASGLPGGADVDGMSLEP